MASDKKIRTYIDDVPEDEKERLSKAWGERKTETYVAAQKHGTKIKQGDSFNKVAMFELYPGLYHLTSDIASTKDISPEHSDAGALSSGLIKKMVAMEKTNGCTPMFASNVCDWDSAYAKGVGANMRLRNSVINACIDNDVVLTGGETANLPDQVRKSGMSWMFTLLSRYDGSTKPTIFADNSMDSDLYETFDHVADSENFQIVSKNGMPFIRVNKKSSFLMTADGTGSKSMVCYQIDKMTDIEDTLAMAGDDGPRDGAIPIFASVGVHAENSTGKYQIVNYMSLAGRKHMIPLLGCVFHESDDVNTYIMNGVVLSEVREELAQTGKKIEPGIGLVLLYEEQRSNGITTQRRVLSETFGEKWYEVNVSEAFGYLNKKLGGKYSKLAFDDERTLGELVAQPSTPYFRVDSMMPEEILDKIKFRINVSSGGLIGKTRRLLEPLGIGADYSDVFDAPRLIPLLQMASRLESSKGLIPDDVAYYTWGCGNGAVIGTTDPVSVRDYYQDNDIRAKIGGVVKAYPGISVASRCLDSKLHSGQYVINHKYTEKPLG
ncbi:MAG: hypothetical protein V1836_01050 [Candidatus Aenigmatarchaeota archaeon]